MSKRSKRDMFAPKITPAHATRLARPTLSLSDVRTDGGTQPRERLDEDTLADYAERMTLDEATGFVLDPEGQKWPELVVYFDGADHWLADGFHRFSAATRAGLESFQVRREEGTQRDAILHSLGVNATHGKRRTNADKRRAIERALLDEEWRQWSDARIASLCKVSSPMVSKLRGALEQRDEIPFEPVLYSADGREFERASTTPASHTKPVNPPRHRATSKTTSVKSFKKLEKMVDDSLDALVAYPTSTAQWELLTTHASRVLHPEHGRLIVHLPSSGKDLYNAPAALSRDASFSSAHLCMVRDHNRHYAIWSHHAAHTPGALVTRAKQLLDVTSSPEVLVLGTSLDAW